VGNVSIVQFQKISILPPPEGIGITRGWQGSVKQKNLQKYMKLNWNFQTNRGSWNNFLPWGRYG